MAAVVSGPFFERAVAITTATIVELERVVASRAMSTVHRILDRRIKHPTPYYETQIMMERAGDLHVVHDSNVIYGPWLEGVSSRNATTRFKGYAAFRRTTQQLDREVPNLVEPVIDRMIRELT